MPGGQVAGTPTSTTFELPGYTVERTLGLSWGLIVRSVGLTKGLTGTGYAFGLDNPADGDEVTIVEVAPNILPLSFLYGSVAIGWAILSMSSCQPWGRCGSNPSSAACG